MAIRGLADGLTSLGHSVTILRPRWPFPSSTVRRLLANLDFSRRARRLRTDLVVGFDFDGFLTRRSDVPYVVCLKGVMADEARFERGLSGLRHRVLARLEGRNARKADLVVVTSEHSRRAAADAYRLRSEDIRIVPEGIRAADWTGRAAPARPSDRPPLILSVARQYRRKNTQALVRAMPGVVREIPDARLRIVGEGPEMARLAGLVRSLRLTEVVTLLGSVDGVDSVREEMTRARVFCLPSRQEGFGIVFLEAMAAGTPIVAARCAAVPETAPHDEVALLIDPDDVDGLTAALLRLLRDGGLADRLGAGGRARWSRFDWSVVGERFLAEVTGL